MSKVNVVTVVIDSRYNGKTKEKKTLVIIKEETLKRPKNTINHKNKTIEPPKNKTIVEKEPHHLPLHQIVQY